MIGNYSVFKLSTFYIILNIVKFHINCQIINNNKAVYFPLSHLINLSKNLLFVKQLIYKKVIYTKVISTKREIANGLIALIIEK